MKQTPWAVLLCKFAGDDSEPYPRSRFEEIFTPAGAGKWNMVDFFRDMSHESIDLSGSRVFPKEGWYTLKQKRSEYLGDNTPVLKRGALLVWGRDAAVANGDDLGGFFNIVVVTNVSADLYGSTDGVATDDGRNPDNGMSSLSPSLLGQEMGHGYNLDHSRIQGSGEDYKDSFDIMSTAAADMAPHPVYAERDVRANPIFLIGPAMNAANMSALGWLDKQRVWTADPMHTTITIELRPLHRRDLPGYLCAKIGNYFVEFRMNEGWDAGLARPVVLVHDFFDGHSYLHRNDTGQDHLLAGDSFSDGDVSENAPILHKAGLQIRVVSIDAASRTARVEIRRWESQQLQAGPGTIFGEIARGGDGFVFVNGHIRRVPPRSPLVEILEHLVDIAATETMSVSAGRRAAQKNAYEAVARIAGARSERLAKLKSPTAVPQTALGAATRRQRNIDRSE